MQFLNFKTFNDRTLNLLKIPAFLAILFLLDFGIGYTLRYFYFKQQYGLEYRTIYSMEKTNADLLVFGSSRANHQYQPFRIEKGFQMSYYNVGRDGTSVFYNYAVLKSVLSRYTPRVIIFDFEPDEFKMVQESYDRISCLLPFYKTHPEIRPIIHLKGPFEKYKLISSIYPFNSNIITIAAGNSAFYKVMTTDFKGYVPLTKTWNKPITTDTSNRMEVLDSNKIKVFRSFITDCIDSGIKLYIVSPPLYIRSIYPKQSIVLGKKIAAEYNIEFLDYTNDSTFLSNPSYYTDFIHFNDEGAKVFTDMLVKDILEKRAPEGDYKTPESGITP